MKWARGFLWTVCFAFLTAVILSPVRVSAGQTVVTLKRDNNILQGTSFDDLPLLFAPGIVQLGSSVSHWDTSATPNLLMEPFLSSDLPFLGLDITPQLMQDIGWELGTSNFNIIDGDDPGTGFTDPRPFAGAPGNDATALGAARQNLIAGVLDGWANTLKSNVDIDVLVTWQPLTCTEGGGAALAGAAAGQIFRSDSGVLPEPDTWYHSALAEAFSGANESGDPAADGVADIFMTINSDIDEACLGEGTRFYYGLDGEEPANLLDLAPTVLHELGHGLGFSNFTNEATGASIDDTPGIFDHFTLDETLGRTWVRMSDAERAESATNEKNLVWSGPTAQAGAGSLLAPGTPVLENPDGDALLVSPASFGAEISDVGVTGALACAFDSSAVDSEHDLPSIRDACQTIENSADVAGKLALVDRGNCSFVTKVSNLQAAGAIAALIANRSDAGLRPGGTDDSMSITIPVAGLSASQGDFLRSLVCPVAPPPDVLFAQWVNGTFNGQDNSVRVILRNRRNESDTGTISFLNGNGDLVSPTGGGGIQPIPYEVPALGTFEFETAGSGTFQSGVVEIRSDLGDNSNLLGTEIFELLGSKVSVPEGIFSPGHQIYVSVDDTENSGMAFFNPHPELYSRILLVLADSDGGFVAAGTIELAPRQQRLGFVTEPGFFSDALADFPDGFKGSLTAVLEEQTSPDFAMLGLIQNTADGSLIAVETAPFDPF